MSVHLYTSSRFVFSIEKHEMSGVLRGQHDLSDGFIAFMLARNIGIEQYLVDQPFNSS